MLYSEFVEGTGCRENDHNYQVYKNLEVMYMNSNMSKQEIYEYGKKLVDNSDTPEQIAFKKQINTEIDEHKRQIRYYQQDIDFQRYFLTHGVDESVECVKERKASIRRYKNLIKQERNMIAGLKWVLA